VPEVVAHSESSPYFADLVVLGPAVLSDLAIYADPHRLALGVHWVVINGPVALQRGQPTRRATGRAMRPGAT
jgi:N-acyl-D-amino-acid deacylase